MFTGGEKLSGTVQNGDGLHRFSALKASPPNRPAREDNSIVSWEVQLPTWTAVHPARYGAMAGHRAAGAGGANAVQCRSAGREHRLEDSLISSDQGRRLG